MKCTRWRLLGIRKCASDEHLKHTVLLFSNVSWNWNHRCPQWSFLLESSSHCGIGGHYLQHGRNHQNTWCKFRDLMHEIDRVYKCILKCVVQTTAAPQTSSVFVKHWPLFWLWHGLCRQSPRITMFIIFLHKLVNVEKRRRWCVSRLLTFRGNFAVKVACKCIQTMSAGYLLIARSLFWPLLF